MKLGWGNTFKTNLPPPEVLHVCRESRVEAMKVFIVCTRRGTRYSPIWFNPHLDTVYVCKDNTPRIPWPLLQSLGEIRHLAIDSRVINKAWLLSFRHLETLTVYAHDYSCPRLAQNGHGLIESRPWYEHDIRSHPPHRKMRILLAKNPDWKCPEIQVKRVSINGKTCCECRSERRGAFIRHPFSLPYNLASEGSVRCPCEGLPDTERLFDF